MSRKPAPRPPLPTDARRIARQTSYDHEEWMEVSPDVYDFFFYNPTTGACAPPTHAVSRYGFYHAGLGRTFICIESDNQEWLTAVSCFNMTIEEFERLNEPGVIDDVIVALGYLPADEI